MITPGTGVAAVAPRTTCVLGADAPTRFLITDMSRCLARLTSSAAVMGEPEISWQAHVAGCSSNARLAWTLARPVVALRAHRAGCVAVTGFASTRRRQVPVPRLAAITGAAHNVGFAGTLPSVFIALGTQGSVRVTATPFAAIQMQREAIVSFKAGIAEGTKHPGTTDTVARDRVAALRDRALQVATAGGAATLHTSKAILTPVTRASREAGLAGTLSSCLVAHLADRACHAAVARSTVSSGRVSKIAIQTFETIPASRVTTATQAAASAVVTVAGNRRVCIGTAATRPTRFTRNGRISKKAIRTPFAFVASMVWRAFQTNVVAFPRWGYDRSTLGGQVVQAGPGRTAARLAVIRKTENRVAIETWQALVAVGACSVVQTFVAFAGVRIARVGVVVAVTFFTAPTKQGVVDTTIAGGTELTREPSIADRALTHLNRCHLRQRPRRLGCHGKIYVVHGSFYLVRVVLGP